MKEVIRNIILENQFSKLPKVFPRDIEIPVNVDKIISIIGVRRSGKTYILYDTITTLLDIGIKKEQILFLNFEDERLNLNSGNLDLILKSYQEIYPEMDFNDVYIFFDEIQNVEGWEKFIRRIYDTKTKHIFVTGSNAKLLSSEISTSLRGRTITYTVYPLNFSEYLNFINGSGEFRTLQERSKLLLNQKKYLVEGSFPETIKVEGEVRLKILQEYFNVMIFRDIIERYKISNSGVLKFFIKKIFASVTKPFSVNKVYNDLKSLGYKISNKYLYNYQDYCDSIFLTKSTSKFDFSEIKQTKSEKKIYVIDNGLLNAIEFSMSENKGKLLENAVCIEFFKMGIYPFYYRDYNECDFIIKHNNELKPVQVSYSIDNDDTRKREFKGLHEACSFLNTSKGIIITFEQEEKISYKGISISIIPFYKYFLKLKKHIG